MAELKTRPTKESVEKFLNGVADAGRRADCLTVMQMMKQATKAKPQMWGTSIVGFGTYHYKYASGQEADWPLTGFSPRKQNLTLYIMPGFARYEELMQKLGKYKTGKSCLYINKLADVDVAVLKQLVKQSVAYMRKKYKNHK